MLRGSRLATLFTRHLLMTFLSLSLFFGGIAILSVRASGWNLFFGLIIIPIGTVLTIFTLDDIARNLIAPPPFKPVKCNVCGKTTYAEEDAKDVICGHCRKDISEEILKERQK